MQKYGKWTQAVQGGYRPENAQPRQVPIVQSTTFKFDNSEFMGKLFDLEQSGYFVSVKWMTGIKMNSLLR